MGNDLHSGSNKMAIAAMSHIVAFDKKELLKLQKEFHKLSRKNTDSDHTITRAQFAEALTIVGIRESDKEILDRVFTLCDETGDEKINFKEFIVGIAPIVRGSLQDKLAFSFELFDVDGTRAITKAEMSRVLKHMNSTASFFGDDMMPEEDVDRVVNDIFEKHDLEKNGQLDYAEYMHAVAEHPMLVEFIAASSGGDTAAKEESK